MLVTVVGGAHALFTILFIAELCIAAHSRQESTKHPTPTRSPVLNLVDLIAGFDHAADDFVSRHHGINRAAPFVSGLMDIGMADATIEDVDLYIVGLDVPALKAERRQLHPWRFVRHMLLCYS